MAFLIIYTKQNRNKLPFKLSDSSANTIYSRFQYIICNNEESTALYPYSFYSDTVSC